MFILALVSMLWQTLAAQALDHCRDTTAAEYDYVVVGAGAGGGPVASRLAEAGYKVLVVDVGHDVDSVNMTIPAYLGRIIEDPQAELNYTISEYPPNFSYQRDDVWYPRARAIGGSAMHNAVINLLANTRTDFAGLEAMFGGSWSLDAMWEYFKLIEKNLYIPGSPDHGYAGWMKTNSFPATVAANPLFLDPQLDAIQASLFAAGPTILDINSRASIGATGVSPPSNTQDEAWERSSVRERLLNVQGTSSSNLEFATDTLATKVLLCQDSGMKQPKAYGVRIARGAGLPVQVGFERQGGDLKTEDVLVRREVIVSAGAFQTPQLLMLSGIGDQTQMSQHNITNVVNLPGVGKNLQDHDEVSVIWLLKKNYTLWNGCTFKYTPEEDPCLKYYQDSGHQNLYAFGPSAAHMPYRSAVAGQNQDPDMDLYWMISYFPMFVHGLGDYIAETHNALTAVALRAHPSSRGFVNLTGSSPQDPLYINKNHFQDPEGGPRDVQALVEGLKRARGIVHDSLIAPNVEKEVWPGEGYESDDGLEKHVYEHVFGHHACCTSKMGTDDDEFAVLDGNFSVRGVQNLRVIDLSIWPNVPGFFVTTVMYMVAEKAAHDIISAAQAESV